MSAAGCTHTTGGSKNVEGVEDTIEEWRDFLTWDDVEVYEPSAPFQDLLDTTYQSAATSPWNMNSIATYSGLSSYESALSQPSDRGDSPERVHNVDRFLIEGFDKDYDEEGIYRLPKSATAKAPEVFTSDWLEHLSHRGILLDDSEALDWSGRGQHAEFAPSEKTLIPLIEEDLVGSSLTADVHSVRCRRIRLARKMIRCNQRFTKEMAIQEVEHLQRLRHQHVIQVVGTYTYKRKLAILLYPVATYNLDGFLDTMVAVHDDVILDTQNAGTISSFHGCLVKAMHFIHDHNIKHMDIKPGNVLVRKVAEYYRVYIADFGIARAYTSADESNTDSPTPFTRPYAAPEVIDQSFRGYSADIFSLGCVFLEMLAVLWTIGKRDSCNQRDKVSSIRKKHGSYQANLDDVLDWSNRFVENTKYTLFPGLRGMLSKQQVLAFKTMMAHNPDERPTAAALVGRFQGLSCGDCENGPEPFEAADNEKPSGRGIVP